MDKKTGPDPLSSWFMLACSAALLFLAGHAVFASLRLDMLVFTAPGLALATDGLLAGLGIAGCLGAGLVFAAMAVRNLWFR